MRHALTTRDRLVDRVRTAHRPLLRRVRRALARRRRARGEQRDALPGWERDVHAAVRHFTRPGPAFEAADGSLDAVARRVRAIAFYLPQFHAFEHNDVWWGKGFTEWTNVARGLPRFAGHYQPRLPRDLGHYDLERSEVMRAQAALARAAGIEAFCFYYYWFDGQRLMERPLDAFAASDIEQEFCIVWANENWTRRWDGREHDVLIEQSYRESDEQAFLDDTAGYMRHARYTRIAGRPLFMIYRAADLPDPERTLQRWREGWSARLGVTPWVLMVQTYDDRDPRAYGLDGAVEFPPHKVSRGIKECSGERTMLDPAFDGQIRRYADVVDQALEEPVPEYPLIKTVSPHWDNDARREGRGIVLHGSSPALYERWLDGAVEHAQAQPFASESLVFVNAWNEWAEGACLEPDVYFGHAVLNATRRALAREPEVPRASRVLLVGHDAHANGAQMILLELARRFVARDIAVTVLLLGGGALLKEYEAVAATLVLDGEVVPARDRVLRDFLEREAFPMAICNSSVSGELVPPIRQTGTRVIALVHELPRIVQERRLQGAQRCIASHADAVVFPATLVAEGFRRTAGEVRGRVVIRPQGIYRPLEPDTDARRRRRLELGAGDDVPVIVNAAYADRRKGFDLFVQTAEMWFDAGRDARFVWVGNRAEEMSDWLREHLGGRTLDARIRLEPFTARIDDWFAAGDAQLLTSREDPFPSVALEAMSLGLPVVSIMAATGLDELQHRFGTLAADSAASSLGAALDTALREDDEASRRARKAWVQENCSYDDYADDLLALLDPARARTVVDQRGES